MWSCIDESVHIVYLWSTGKLYVYELRSVKSPKQIIVAHQTAITCIVEHHSRVRTSVIVTKWPWDLYWLYSNYVWGMPNGQVLVKQIQSYGAGYWYIVFVYSNTVGAQIMLALNGLFSRANTITQSASLSLWHNCRNIYDACLETTTCQDWHHGWPVTQEVWSGLTSICGDQIR